MKQCKTLETLFPGPVRPILAALYGAPGRWWSLSELALRAGAAPGELRRRILQLRGGGLIRNRRDKGRVWFQADPSCPIYAELQSIIAKLSDESPPRATILVVEDQPATARITRILLESWGYGVLEAHEGGEAIRIFEQSAGEIHLLLTDVLMPGMTGPQLAEELLRRNPDLKVIYMSGYPNRELIERNAAFLPKPFNPASLSRAVGRELEQFAQRGRRPNINSHSE